MSTPSLCTDLCLCMSVFVHPCACTVYVSDFPRGFWHVWTPLPHRLVFLLTFDKNEAHHLINVFAVQNKGSLCLCLAKFVSTSLVIKTIVLIIAINSSPWRSNIPRKSYLLTFLLISMALPKEKIMGKMHYMDEGIRPHFLIILISIIKRCVLSSI